MSPTLAGMTEPDIVINGHPLTFGEAMAVRVAVGNFLIMLRDQPMRAGIGDQLALNYEQHLANVERKMMRATP